MKDPVNENIELARYIEMQSIDLRNDIRHLNNSQRLTAERRVALLEKTYNITDAAYRIMLLNIPRRL